MTDLTKLAERVGWSKGTFGWFLDDGLYRATNVDDTLTPAGMRDLMVKLNIGVIQLRNLRGEWDQWRADPFQNLVSLARKAATPEAAVLAAALEVVK